jgi:hypothetical protein
MKCGDTLAPLLILALDGSEWLTWLPCHFTAEERDPDTCHRRRVRPRSRSRQRGEQKMFLTLSGMEHQFPGGRALAVITFFNNSGLWGYCTAATPGLLCQPRLIVKMIVEKQMECRLAGEPKFSEKTCPSATFVHHKVSHDQTRVWIRAAAVGIVRAVHDAVGACADSAFPTWSSNALFTISIPLPQI